MDYTKDIMDKINEIVEKGNNLEDTVKLLLEEFNYEVNKGMIRILTILYNYYHYLNFAKKQGTLDIKYNPVSIDEVLSVVANIIWLEKGKDFYVDWDKKVKEKMKEENDLKKVQKAASINVNIANVDNEIAIRNEFVAIEQMLIDKMYDLIMQTYYIADYKGVYNLMARFSKTIYKNKFLFEVIDKVCEKIINQSYFKKNVDVNALCNIIRMAIYDNPLPDNYWNFTYLDKNINNLFEEVANLLIKLNLLYGQINNYATETKFKLEV